MIKHLIKKFVLLCLAMSAQWVLAQDLVITSLAVNAPLYTNGGLSVTVTEANIGSQTAVYHWSGFYVSSDSVLSNDDQLLGSYTVDEMYGNRSKALTSSSYWIPSTLPIGEYYVIVKADHENKSKETNENNNTRSTKVNIQKGFWDFKFNSLKSPYLMAIKRGETIELEISISNLGNIQGTVNDIRYVLTWDTSYTNNPTNEYSMMEGYTLNPGETKTFRVMLKTSSDPMKTPLGKRYLVGILNWSKGTPESNYNNNKAVAPTQCSISYNADLTPDSIKVASSTVAAGDNLNSTLFVSNKGTDALPSASWVRYYLSTDALGNTNVLDLGSGYFAIGANASTTTSQTSNIPFKVVPGKYYLNAQTTSNYSDFFDPYGKNWASIPITVLPSAVELKLSSLSELQTVAPGALISYAFLEENVGTMAAPYRYFRYYFSKDSLLDASDVSLWGSTNSNYLEPGKSFQYGPYNYKVPVNTLSGEYYLLMKTDAEHQISEKDESNNVSALKVLVSTVTDVDHEALAFDINLYPNPSSGLFHINHPEQELKVEVYNASSQIVYATASLGTTLDLQHLPLGVYMVKLRGKEDTSMQKIVISK